MMRDTIEAERTEHHDPNGHDEECMDRLRTLETDFAIIRQKLKLDDEKSQIKYRLLKRQMTRLAEDSKRTSTLLEPNNNNNMDAAVRVPPERTSVYHTPASMDSAIQEIHTTKQEFGEKYEELKRENERLSQQVEEIDDLKRNNEKLSQQLEDIKKFVDSTLIKVEHNPEHQKLLTVEVGDLEKVEDEFVDTETATQATSEDEEFEHHYLPEDTFSYFAVADYFRNFLPTTSLFLALFAILIQVTTLSIFLSDVINFDVDNPISAPPGVSSQVRGSQLIALMISCWNQDEIRASFNVLSLGYNPGRVRTINLGANCFKWYLSITLRILVGIYTLIVTFILIINSETVRDVMLDFAAVTFVSELDNGAFLLSLWGYMGHNLQKLTMRIKNIPVFEKRSSNKEMRQRKVPRLMSLFFLIFALIGFWAWISEKQARGEYMDQTIYVQFGDDYSPAIGAFSGLYRIVVDDSFNSIRASYVELGSESAVFSYCSSDSIWLFQYGSRPVGDSSCWSNARSSKTDDLDITNTASFSTWYVKDEDLLEMPLQHFSISGREHYYGQPCEYDDDCGDRMYCEEDGKDQNTCVCMNGHFGLNCEFPDPCRVLDIDPRNDGFLGTRSWSRRFSSVREEGKDRPMEVYGKPIYIGDTSVDEALDVMIFTGRRWILTHSNNIDDYKPSSGVGARRHLAEFLASSFHAYWSNYTFYFVSEPVDFGKPIFSATPVDLQWFQLETSGTQGASLRSGKKIWQGQTTVEAKLFCAVCDSETNPCFYGAVCSADGSCECTTGSSGGLCQIPPDGNGFCDVFFNTPEFSYDGGDCCKETCKSTERYTCGKGMIENEAGVSAYGFIGYPDCQDPRYSSKLAGSTTLFEIFERGTLRCGSEKVAGFYEVVDGVVSGFEVDLCKSIAAAALGDAEALEMIDTSANTRFVDLNEGKFDVLIRRTTHTAERDVYQSGANTGFSFAPIPTLFNGLRFGGIPPFSECADKVDFESTRCLGLKICVNRHTTWLEATENLFPDSTILAVESFQAEVDGLEAGICNVIAGEITYIAEVSVRERGFTGAVYQLGENEFSKEPLSAVTAKDDRVWFKFVSWVFEALIQAEESGITKETAQNLAPTDVFGDEFQNMFQNAVAANGNYGEIYEKNLQERIPRSGLNNINRGESGLIYAFPFGAIETRGPDPVVGGSMDAIRKRRVLNCGIEITPGFATRDPETGIWRGFEVDMCRGIAAALFSGSTNVNFIPLTTSERFTALAENTIDVLTSTTTHTLTREVKELTTGEGFDFTPTIFHDGMGFGGVPPYALCAEILDFTSSALSPECPNTRICVISSSSWMEAIESQLNIPEQNLVLTASQEETYDKFNSGECNVMTGESAQLAEATVRNLGYPEDREYFVSGKKFTKEPLAIVSRSNDAQFSDFLRWVVFGFFYAAENEITRDRYFEMPASNYLFGNSLTGMWRHAIEAVGNYDEMFERNFEGVLERGILNQLNNEAGPQFFAKRGVTVK